MRQPNFIQASANSLYDFTFHLVTNRLSVYNARYKNLMNARLQHIC